MTIKVLITSKGTSAACSFETREKGEEKLGFKKEEGRVFKT